MSKAERIIEESLLRLNDNAKIDGCYWIDVSHINHSNISWSLRKSGSWDSPSEIVIPTTNDYYSVPMSLDVFLKELTKYVKEYEKLEIPTREEEKEKTKAELTAMFTNVH